MPVVTNAINAAGKSLKAVWNNPYTMPVAMGAFGGYTKAKNVLRSETNAAISNIMNEDRKFMAIPRDWVEENLSLDKDDIVTRFKNESPQLSNLFDSHTVILHTKVPIGSPRVLELIPDRQPIQQYFDDTLNNMSPREKFDNYKGVYGVSIGSGVLGGVITAAGMAHGGKVVQYVKDKINGNKSTQEVKKNVKEELGERIAHYSTSTLEKTALMTDPLSFKSVLDKHVKYI